MSKFTLKELVALIETKTNYQPQKRGDSYQCRCPAHEDDAPSLSVSKGDKQPYVLYCHAGCSHDQIMAALGVAAPALNGNGATAVAVPTAGKLAKPKKRGLGELVAQYHYHDAAGNLAYIKNRYTPKTFRVVGANGKWGLQGATPTLYNADLIAEADPDTPIWVVEGEKDADNLALFLDVLATCNYDGAGKWSEDYTALLEGRHVVIIADNDQPGRAHAQLVADALAPVAASLRLVNLDGLPVHGDVTDYLNAPAFSPAALWERVEAADDLAAKKERDFDTEKPKTIDYRKAMQWLGYTVRWNELTDTVELNGRAIDDVREAALRSQMQDLGLRGITRMNDAALVEANENRYHPIKDYFNGLQWDGHDWIGKLFNTYIEEETGFGETAWRRWMIGAVAKIFANAQNAMLVWDGGQDVGKSHLARWLCPLPEYYVEAQLNPDDKDSLVRLATKFVWEVPEVDATTRKAEVAALKDFITREVVTVRRAYAKYDMVKPACASLIGTINSDGAGFLRDTTGNRRFLTIRLARIDWSYTKELDVNQLWAQAVAMFRDGEPWRLTASERQMRDAINREYQTQNYLEVLFDKLFIVDPERNDQWLTSDQIMDELEAAGLKGSQNQNLKELKAYLHKLGARSTRPRLANGSRPTAYTGVMHIPNDPGAVDL